MFLASFSLLVESLGITLSQKSSGRSENESTDPRASPWKECVVAVCCSVLQCVAVCCSVLQCFGGVRTNPLILGRVLGRSVLLQCVTVCCSVLQCFAVRCRALQCVAVCCSVLQCVAVCCSVLQCVAMCCSVLHPLILGRLLGRSTCQTHGA